MNILITGAAGFIGFHLSKHLLNSRVKVFGIDNYNNYYDVNLKKNRIKLLKKNKNFKFYKIDLSNKITLNNTFKNIKFNYIIHLAAQPGVRVSINKPKGSFRNIETFFNILEFAKSKKVKHFLFASSSSVYGNQKFFPTSENDNSNQPLSLYAATKKTNETLAYSYSSSHLLPCTGLRFFTVYGPYGRPDMALFKFVNCILNNKKVELYNEGNHQRDFTYIDDVIKIITRLIYKPSKNFIPFNIFNIGKGKSINLKKYLNEIQSILSKKAIIKNLPLQVGDVGKTHANISKVVKYVNFKPIVEYKEGLKKYINWHKSYYNQK